MQVDLLRTPVLYLLCLLSTIAAAQASKRNFRQRELGFFAGGSYYIGDINPRGHFLFTQPAGGIFFRYTTNYRYSFRLGANYGKITASDSRSKEPDQLERNLNFTSNIIDGHALAEFNFLEYRIGHERHRFTMFVFAGLGLYYFNPKSDRGRGMEALRDYETEGESYKKVQMSIPFGVGFKLNVGKSCGIGVEWGPRRTFTDYLDDVSGSYPASGTSGFTDRTLNNSASPGSMRGNPSTKDWYFYYGVTFNFKLPEKKPCNTTY